MMLFGLVTFVISECLLAGHGNVCMSFFVWKLHYYLLNVLSSSYTVHAMQSKPTMSLVAFQDNDGDFLDYAINNKLTPFISMKNHYNLIYREEEREMFPTLKVSMTPICAKDLFKIYYFLALGRWCDSLVPSCSRSSCTSFWK